MDVSIENFKSKLRDFARPNRFKVWFTGLDWLPMTLGESDYFYNVLPYSVVSAKIPNKSIPEIEIKRYGWQLYVSSDHIFETIDVTFLVDENMHIRSIMENWFNTVHNYNDTNKTPFEIYKNTKMFISQLGRQGETIKTYELYDVIPVSLSEIDLSMENENQIERFTVTFKYSYYHIV